MHDADVRVRKEQHASVRRREGVFEPPGGERARARPHGVSRGGGSEKVESSGVVAGVGSNDAVTSDGERKSSSRRGGGVRAALDAVLRHSDGRVDALDDARGESDRARGGARGGADDALRGTLRESL